MSQNRPYRTPGCPARRFANCADLNQFHYRKPLVSGQKVAGCRGTANTSWFGNGWSLPSRQVHRLIWARASEVALDGSSHVRSCIVCMAAPYSRITDDHSTRHRRMQKARLRAMNEDLRVHPMERAHTHSVEFLTRNVHRWPHCRETACRPAASMPGSGPASARVDRDFWTMPRARLITRQSVEAESTRTAMAELPQVIADHGPGSSRSTATVRDVSLSPPSVVSE